ncbi:MAG: 2-succinyl-5-enolpyruvyl-6-hydroxy-3-cyclohexene-1-carboxylic-acid synthase, partial [Planctomycetota bacterium]
MIDKIWAEIAVDSCLKRNIDHFFVAPGSRCTPLTLAIANNQSSHVTQHFDERGLAFAALGYARATGRPGVFVCTSGTAVANAFPAVVEASMDRVPLLLFTADRPDELRGIGANQTIEQRNIFGDYPEVFLNFSVPNNSGAENEERACLLKELDSAFSKSADGPVHVNWMFHEPFTIDGASEEGEAAEQEKSRVPVGDLFERHKATQAARETPLEIQGNTVIALGNGRPQESREAQRLAKHLNCPLLVDVTSGISACGFELPTEFELPQPDTVLHLGDRITSKSWIAWTKEAASSGTKFVHVTPTGQVVNPASIELTRHRFPFTELDSRIEAAVTSDAFTRKWQEANAKRTAAIESVLAASESLSEPAVAYFLSEHCPGGEGLFIGNSMPIRDMDRYGVVGTAEVRNVAANRGASGID